MNFRTSGDLNSSFASTYMTPLDVILTLGLLPDFFAVEVSLLTNLFGLTHICTKNLRAKVKDLKVHIYELTTKLFVW